MARSGQKPVDALAYDDKTVAWLDPALQTGFTQIPNAVLRDPRLTLLARGTYGILASFAWEGEECWPGQERLAGLLCVSERHLRRAITELRRAGLVEVRRRGHTQTNIYRLLLASSPDRTRVSAQDRTRVADKEDTRKKKSVTSKGIQGLRGR